MLVVVLVLENFDRFAIRLTEQISSIGLFAVTKSQCTEDETRRGRGRFQISEFGFKSSLTRNKLVALAFRAILRVRTPYP